MDARDELLARAPDARTLFASLWKSTCDASAGTDGEGGGQGGRGDGERRALWKILTVIKRLWPALEGS